MTVQTIPEVQIDASGSLLSAQEISSLGKVRVQQRLSLPTQCELTFIDPGNLDQLVTAFAPGTELEVNLTGQAETLFEGDVTALEYIYGPAHQLELRVRGYDRLHRLRKRQAVQVYTQVSLVDLANELVNDLGVMVQAEASGPVWPILIQHRQSHLDLLCEAAEQSGMYLALRGDVLHLMTLEGIGPALPLVLGDNLLEAQVEVSQEAAGRSVRAAGWNPLSVEAFQGQADSARVGRDVEAEAPPEAGWERRERTNETVHDVDAIQAVAQGELDRRVAFEVNLWGVAEGNTQLSPGAPVEIEGVAPGITGTYVVTSVTHTIDGEKGYVSEFSTLPPPPRERPRGSGVALGIVTRVNDPQNLGRVRVSFPAYADVESEWMHVVSPAASRDKGWIALPDVDDSVLVLFPQEDPSQGIVLGGLYGKDGPADSGVEGNSVRRYILLTRDGQRVVLDDAQHKIRLEDRTGNFVELSPQTMILHAAVDLLVEAPGKAVVIQGQNIDFRRA